MTHPLARWPYRTHCAAIGSTTASEQHHPSGGEDGTYDRRTCDALRPVRLPSSALRDGVLVRRLRGRHGRVRADVRLSDHVVVIIHIR